MSYLGKDRLITHWKMGNEFLESGFIDLREEGFQSLLFAPQATPGAVHYTDSVKAALAEETPYLDKAIQPDSAPKRGYTKGMDSLSFKATKAGTGIGNKRIQWIFNTGSEYSTGKLRLALQAQYGSEDVDPESENEISLPLLTYGQRNKQSKSYALYSGSVTEPDYWILTIKTDTVEAEKLEIPSGVKSKLYERLITADDAERAKIEAYLLSRIKTGSNQSTLNASFTATEGTTFAYGWKANSLGTELVMVTNEAVLNVQENPLYHVQRLYKLNISITKDNNGDYSMTANNVKSEEVNCTPENGIQVLWYPDFEENKMKTFNWHAGGGYPDGPIEEEGAPMYAFYDNDDKLVVFRHYLKPEESDGADQAELTQKKSLWEDSEKICISGSQTNKDSWSLAFTVGGFYVDVDGQGTPGGVENKSVALFSDYDISVVESGNSSFKQPGSPTGFDENHVPGWCGDEVPSEDWLGLFGKYPATYYNAAFNHRLRTSNAATIAGDSVLIITFGDEAAYLGTMLGEGGLFHYIDESTDIYNRVVSAITGGTNGSEFSAAGDGGGVGSGAGTGVQTPLSDLHDTARQEQKYDVELYLHSKYGAKPAIEISVESTHESDSSYVEQQALFKLGRIAGLFNPVVNVYPFFDVKFEVQESVGGTAIYIENPNVDPAVDRVAITDDFEDVPDDVTPFDVGPFVGWS